ncbi:MAG: hypothetical protein V2J10_12320, partial [Wenzhouxiangella sp.]|nr:hypothetical protein [Wenzhouxiangella sp.]
MTRANPLDEGLVAEVEAEFSWAVKIVDPAEYRGKIDADIVFEPRMPFFLSDLYNESIVIDLRALIDSVIRPGRHFILNCICGMADCVDLEDGVHVAHPDERQIIWEVDIDRFAPALCDDIGATGFVRLVFDRAQYLGSIQSM